MSADSIIEFLRWYAGERLNSRLIDEHRRPPASLPADLASGGLLGLRVGVEHGGQGLSGRDTARVLEQLGAIDGNVSLLTTVHNAVGVDPILAFADQDTKDKVLPVLASTGALAGVAATEPEVGTNFQAMTSRAVRDGSGYVINGTKWHPFWTGSSTSGDALISACRIRRSTLKAYPKHGNPERSQRFLQGGHFQQWKLIPRR